DTNPELKKAYETEPDVKTILDAARQIEGHIRGEGVHACATIICRDPMSDHVPMKRDTKGGGSITQYDGHYTPDLGLLKMDFLGLRTLGVLSRACRNVEARTGQKLKPEEIPINDEKAFELMRSGNTDGLFQVESALYVKLFSKLPPRRFSDIVASIALNRPGPLESGMVDDYVKVASGQVEAHYYDDRLKPLLEETYGTMVYQEQIMRISMVMSGFSAGKADKLRKAMGKKKIDIMRALKEDWNEGAVANGYSLEIAKQIWDEAESFAKYAFNKSHSACYAILVMRTAYLKAHYPNEYMAAVLSSYMGNTDRLNKYIASCNHNGTPVLPPDVNSSNIEFTPVDEGIRFGLMGVRGVGKNVAEAIIAERNENGPFSSLHDFVHRMDAKSYNRKTLEALIKSGAFDSTGYTRRQLMYFINETPLLEGASSMQRAKDIGQMSMFDLFDDTSNKPIFEEEIPEPDGNEWTKRELLGYEKEIMGIYVSDHPLRPYEPIIARLTQYSMGDLSERTELIPSSTFVGMISNVNVRLMRSQKKMATFTLEDTSGSIDCICFKYDDYSDEIEEDAIVKIKGKFEHGDRGNQITAYEVEKLELKESDLEPIQMRISISTKEFNESKAMRLNRLLGDYPGRDTITLRIIETGGKNYVAKLPVSVDARSQILKTEILNLFETGAISA
ncbi:MAG: DNA polymerase III subunit alpha, partial [Eggerthellaceae bacterium]|nr:DNA polymerase III subunit alpha [Eggerthellaceae bacterium]